MITEIFGLEKLLADFDALPVNLAKAQDEIAAEITIRVKRNTARRTGKLQDSWKAQNAVTDGDARTVLIDTASDNRVTYSDIYERGRNPGGTGRNANHPGYSGRFPVKRALDDFSPAGFFDEAMDASFS